MLKRTPLKKKIVQLKRSKIKVKVKPPEGIEEDRLRHDKDWKFYNEIWNERLHTCQSCLTPILGELKSTYMDHILPKSQFEDLRYEKDNIIMVCERCHTMKTNCAKVPDKYNQIIEATKLRFRCSL